ncbi:hypothetical protein CYLTODRAFT_444774 [Cylindrobasidium torrendii FP15055 ss-10]|uniref:HMG box domain-containing protein n=1 Tax=Cylindrobasidium torrendii FP15055 ss-10 TaxID=1314674 RepID=A0A0D7B803_9AGAR|nr:hypothetical protein CYLTODRAFT_444774 [Cylindrobasidium torrendii FP15055 ss-10]
MSTYPTSSPSVPNATCTSTYVPNGSELTFAQPLTPENTQSSAKSKSKSKSPAAFDEAGNEIKRPLNKFMLYRQEMGPKFVADTKITDHRQISRMVAAAWRALGPAGQQPWADQADAAQRRHQQMYPDYKFQPKPKVERQKRKTYGNTKEHLAYIAQLGERAAANEDLSEVAQAYAMVKDEPRAKRRSRKAPTDLGPAASVPSGSTARKARAAVRAASEESYSSNSTSSSSLSSVPSSGGPSPPPPVHPSYFADPYFSPSTPWGIESPSLGYMTPLGSPHNDQRDLDLASTHFETAAAAPYPSVDPTTTYNQVYDQNWAPNNAYGDQTPDYFVGSLMEGPQYVSQESSSAYELSYGPHSYSAPVPAMESFNQQEVAPTSSYYSPIEYGQYVDNGEDNSEDYSEILQQYTSPY